jgi:hypothetical protein
MRRRLLALAVLASSMTTLALLYATLTQPAIAGLVGGVLALAAAAAALRTWWTDALPPIAIRVDGEGRIAARRQGDGAEVALEPAFVSSWLLCLQGRGRGAVVVWHDALQADAYRRLAAASRWPRRRKPEFGAISDGLA